MESIGLERGKEDKSGDQLQLGQALRPCVVAPGPFVGDGFNGQRVEERQGGRAADGSSCSFWGRRVGHPLQRGGSTLAPQGIGASLPGKAVSGWRGNARRGMAPRGDRLLEKEKL